MKVQSRKKHVWMRLASVVMSFLMIISLLQINTVETKAESWDMVHYKVHRQSYGWEEEWKTDGETSGTVGEGKRLEGIKIEVIGTKLLDVEYRTHIQSIGWESEWKKNGEMSGTEGQGKRLEAIQIKLSGGEAEMYDIYYRVHAQSYGWLGWAKNGESAGTAGQGKRLEAIEIVVVPKERDPEDFGVKGSMACPFIDLGKNPSTDGSGSVSYMTHVQSYGDQKWVSDGSISGTSGEAKRLEQIRIKVDKEKLGCQYGGIEYQTHVQSYGWMDWVKDGEASGTSGQGKRLEAIRINLTGELASNYDIYYRVHAQSYGWLGWVKNGQTSGTAGLGKRLEAIQITIVPKGTDVPNYLPAKAGMQGYIGAAETPDTSENVPAIGTEKIYVYCANSELEQRIETHFFTRYPEYRDLVDIVNLDTSSTGTTYASKMFGDESRPASIVALDSDVVGKYINDNRFVPVSNIGITDSDYANAYEYTKKIGTYNGELKFLAFQAYPGCFAYRADIAEAVWGTSDPEVIQEKIKDWNSFLAAAEEIKEKGYYTLSGPDDIMIARSFLMSDWGTGVIEEDDIYKALVAGDYTKGTTMWSTEWVNNMNSNVFGYFACPWFINWTLAYPSEENASYGNWKVCEGPEAFYWGGTYLGITDNCPNKELAALLIKTLCCDTDVMYDLYRFDLDYPNNKAAVEKLIADGIGEQDNLGGQNPLPYYHENGLNIE